MEKIDSYTRNTPNILKGFPVTVLSMFLNLNESEKNLVPQLRSHISSAR